MNRINFLPPWVETNCQPAFYDKESGTVLQQTARMYAKVNQLVRNVNDQNETIELYIAKFVELHDYVYDYFDNLDVQEEINNKLDDMVEQGTLQEIITQYIQANVEWTFDTVADMVASENLINGSYAVTLGYHSLNDDGGATYKIRTVTNEDVADGGSIIALNDNTLVAELIKDGVINVKQFGAYGDGVHDDGTAIQTAIDYIDDQAHELGRSMADNQLQVPAGKYKITNTVKLKTTVKLRTIGMASFEYYGDDVCIWIMNNWTSAPDDRFGAGEWLEGALIDGVGLNIKNMNATDSQNAHDRGNTTALEVGVRSSTAYDGYNRVSIYTINHVKITNFNLAIKINSIYTFVCNYECVDILRCNTCVEFGTSGVSVNNGTEKLSFTSCMIGGGVDVGFKWNAAPIHVSFYNCSLDYMNAVFVDTDNFNNPNNIAVFGGHIEGIGEGLDNNPSGKFGLVDGYFNKSTVVLNAPLLAIRNEPRIIKSTTLKDNLRIVFNSVEMNYSGGSDTLITPDYAFISNRPIEVNTISANSYINDYADGSRSILMRTFSPYNSLYADNLLQNATEGSFSISNGTQVDSFIIKSSGNITSGNVTTDNPITGGKVMTLTPSNATSTFVIKTVKIRADSNTWYKANFITKGTTSRGITFTFYDRDDNELFESNESVSNMNIDASKWYQTPYSKVCKAPSGTDYMILSFKCVSQNNTNLDPIKIAGCFVEKIS